MNRNVQILLGLGIIGAAGAYFLLRSKDEEVAEVPPYVPPYVPPTSTTSQQQQQQQQAQQQQQSQQQGQTTPPGTMVQATVITPAAPVSPMVQAQVREGMVKPAVIRADLFAPKGSSTGSTAPALTNLIRSGAFKF